MKSASIHGTLFASFLVAVFFLTVSSSEAKVLKLTCSPTKGLNASITKLKPGDTLQVSGNCTENVVVPEQINRIIIDGVDKATRSITPSDPDGTTMTIRGRDVTVRNLTVNGGQTGIAVRGGGTAVIENNTIQGASGSGLVVNQQAFARIINNTIQNNGNNGVAITENSNARVGFLTNNDTAALPNTITGNNRGIVVSESSSAVIVGNNISNNALEGVLVNTVSHADVASNTIDGNGNHGVQVGRNSGVDLGADTGTSIFESPNSTTPGSENVGFGLRCFINSYADRRLGTLNGTSGAKDAFTGGCIDSTIP